MMLMDTKRKLGSNLYIRKIRFNTWKLKTTLLKNAWINQGIKEELKQFMETNENEDTSLQNLWDTAMAVPREKYIAIQPPSKKLKNPEYTSCLYTLKNWRINNKSNQLHT